MKDLLQTLIIFGFIIALCLFGVYKLVYSPWVDNAIRTTEPIHPQIELVVKDTIVDTIYVYKIPY